jgi:hypothetical protein
MLWGYTRHAIGRRGGLTALTIGVAMGGLIDWPAFFFAAALAAVELVRVARDRAASRRALIVLVAVTPLVFAFDIWHLWYAAGGSLQPFTQVLQSKGPGWGKDSSISRFVLGQLDTFRRYFTHAGFIATLLVAACLIVPRSRTARDLWQELTPIGRRLLAATSLAALAYIVAAPRWASAHQYWQFYFLPAAILSMVLAWRFLERRLAGRRARALTAIRVLVVVELLASSVYWLHFRHTRVEAHAVETTRSFRERLLLPSHLDMTNQPGR